MFSFGEEDNEDENTPFFEDFGEEKPSIFDIDGNSQEDSAFQLFNSNSQQTSKLQLQAKSSKKTIIDGLADFNPRESFAILEEIYS